MPEKPPVSLATVAVILTCDAGYLPFSLHLARQILHHCPDRRFDLLIASENALNLPDWAEVGGIRNLVIPDTGWIDALPMRHLSRAAYLRLCLPQVLGDTYRRILYLDSDMYFEGGDLDRLLNLPLGDHPIGAVTDIDQFYDPSFHAREFKALAVPALRYFNAGVLLMDSAACRRGAIFQRCVDFASDEPKACVLHDQSLLNGVIQGRFAELAPGWNWQSAAHLPFATLSYPVRFRHFVGRVKPWNDPSGVFDPRYRENYAGFFRTLMPEEQALVKPGPKPALIDLEHLVTRVISHARRRKVIGAALARFSDEWEVKL